MQPLQKESFGFYCGFGLFKGKINRFQTVLKKSVSFIKIFLFDKKRTSS